MIGLIPRVRVNYSFVSWLMSLFVSEKSYKYRTKAQKMLSEYYGGRPVLMTSAGRCGLYYIFKKLKQRKVMIPAYTCTVVAEAAIHAGKEIVYVPISDDSFNANNFEGMDSDTIVVATHQYGYHCDIEHIAEECDRTGAILVEDCASAIGTLINGKRAGTFGDYAILSFNHSKQLIVPGGGGCIIARNQSLLEGVKQQMHVAFDKRKTLGNKRYALICLLLNNNFLYRRYHKDENVNQEVNVEICKETCSLYQYQMDEWQAYLLIPQIKKIKKLSEKRKRLFSFYRENIKNTKIILPPYQHGADYSRFAVQIIEDRKYEFYDKCVQSGVDLDFSHSHLTCEESFKKEYKIASSILNLPFYYNLSMREAKRVVEVINKI